jgi:signal transduction histidine kinase
MAGRVLTPLRTMTARAQRISERNLHERLALSGPDDELRELGDTFDGLLGRLERAFEAQRRFVANASHELRTPLTAERAMVEVALADPELDIASLRDVCERVISAGEDQERLIEALLTLARSQRGLERREQFDLADVVKEALTALGGRSSQRLPTIESLLARAPLAGDRQLIERLVVNLLDNAVGHNTDGGWVEVRTSQTAGQALLRIANSGPRVATAELGALLEPFRRAASDRAGQHSGHGLGLSIAAAIAETHGTSIRLNAREGGGLEVEVAFPAAAATIPAIDAGMPERRSGWPAVGPRAT